MHMNKCSSWHACWHNGSSTGRHFYAFVEIFANWCIAWHLTRTWILSGEGYKKTSSDENTKVNPFFENTIQTACLFFSVFKESIRNAQLLS